MEASAITPQKKSRHNSHPQRTLRSRKSDSHQTKDYEAAVQSLENPFQQSSELLPDTSQNSPLAMPRTTSTPLTPPRPRSMYEGTYTGQSSGVASASDSNEPLRKSSQKAQNRRSNPPSSKSKTNGTPRSKKQRNFQTPGKPTTTPSQAYAGPTFHASPAASSLPIPKFFQKSLSKSVPETNQPNGLSVLLDSEVSADPPSPENSEPSPVQEKAERVGKQAREASPLDIFFHADREEKTRARLANITNHDHANTRDGVVNAADGALHDSPSPLPETCRHHSRQHTGSSAGGLFPIDLEQEKSPSQTLHSTASPPSVNPGHLSRANSAPTHTLTDVAREEAARRKARSAELMKLLGTEKPEKPSSLSPSISTTTAPKSHTRPAHDSSGPFAATPPPDSKVQILSRKHPASLPQLQKQFGLPSSSTQSPRARPPSNLRQEVSVPASPAHDGLPELPATPTPSRINVPPSSENNNVSHNNSTSSLPSSALQGVGCSQIQDPKYVNMENDLRRILRLDILGSDGS
ncbi:hypothetical protein G7Y79_00007g020790 [Physcia stellaris]|nr:hypothetical protein G7Y79_00007g020790 [Physcia stellaris]